MTIKSKIILPFFLVILAFNSHILIAQQSSSKKIIKQLDNLLRLNKLDSVVTLSKTFLDELNPKNSKDSLFFANLYFYNYLGRNYASGSIKNKEFLLKSISYCPKSTPGDSLKAVLYNSKAYLEYNLGKTMNSYKSINKSLNLLEEIQNPNAGYIMGAYLLLSNINAYYGNFEQAKHYMRLAEGIYAKNKKFIDKNTWELNGNNHRLVVIAKYRKIYMFWKLSKTSADSLQLVNTMKELEKIHSKPDFHKEERIYYSTALNHVGDWYISNKHDSLTTQKAVKTGLKYLLKTHYLVDKKGYPGTSWAIKYNIAKGFTRRNQLKKADSTMAVLFNGISKNDGRIPFFLAQKGLIKAKKNEKDSALFYFSKIVNKIHQGKDSLKADYSNFIPSKNYNETNLLIRISEELNYYYPKDTLINKKVYQIYTIALQQFENSYLDINFNDKQNKQLRKIIQGILKGKKTGHQNLQEKTILNKFEIFKNQLNWKKFYESRYTNILPELDAVKQRKQALASLLNKAKIADNFVQEDSIQQLINKHENYKNKQFPQLKLLTNVDFSIEKLQEDLKPNDVILKYILLENEIAMYQISKADFKVNLLSWTKKEENSLKEFIKKTRNRNYDLALANRLGKILLPKLDDKTTNIIINPDGILFNLPFEILKTKNKFATEIYNISYTSNLGFINYKTEKLSPLKNTHIYAPLYTKANSNSDVRNKVSFLKGANKEAESISKLFPSKLFNDESLTKSEFIKTANKAKILHLAMHADVNYNYPQLSRLLFSNNNKNETEHLYLEELYGLSLRADLAILSACNTGIGLEKNGTLESFQRAFTFAGVPATVASLWEVPDLATEQIMVLFYKNLKAGQTKSEALKNAKLNFRNKNINNKLSEPFFWSGFVVYGNNTPIIKSSNTSTILYIIIVIVFIATIIWYWKRENLK